MVKHNVFVKYGKNNDVVKYGTIQHNAAAILLQYRPTIQKDAFRFTKSQHQVHSVLQCSSGKWSYLRMDYM